MIFSDNAVARRNCQFWYQILKHWALTNFVTTAFRFYLTSWTFIESMIGIWSISLRTAPADVCPACTQIELVLNDPSSYFRMERLQFIHCTSRHGLCRALQCSLSSYAWSTCSSIKLQKWCWATNHSKMPTNAVLRHFLNASLNTMMTWAFVKCPDTRWSQKCFTNISVKNHIMPETFIDASEKVDILVRQMSDRISDGIFLTYLSDRC